MRHQDLICGCSKSGRICLEHGKYVMGEEPVPEESLRSKAIKMLFEMAVMHWRLGSNSPAMNPHRRHAMKLHKKATNLELGVVDDDL